MITSPNLSVLLIEDNELDVEVVRRAFKKKDIGADLVHCDSGRRGLQTLRDQRREKANKVVIVFLDLNMPAFTGHDFLAELRDDNELHSTTTFVLTTSDHVQDIEMAYQKHVAGYFTKDNIDDLVDVLATYQTAACLPKL